jgi:hypothetical protein
MILHDVGYCYLTKQDYLITIVEVISKTRFIVKFESGFELEVTKRAIESGLVKYPFHPTVFDVGYLGVGKYGTTDKTSNRISKSNKRIKLAKAYQVWQGMLGRCYCPIVQIKQPNIRNLTVHIKWLNYQIFAKWFEENYIEGFDMSQNILIPKSTVYSPETCCFVPNEIRNSLSFVRRQKHNLPMGVMPNNNSFSAGIHIKGQERTHLGTYSTPQKAFSQYKHAKQLNLQNLAKKHKDKLPIKTYNALMKFKVKAIDQTTDQTTN